ncbi:MAG: hypothetical protein IJS45_12010 [Clostridia bacterium]|nr:hypothetical protein [Clostridia bacterium]
MFWKDYGKTIRRMWLNQFGALAFALMLSFISTTVAKKVPDYSTLVYVVSGVIGVFFYGYLIYLVIWELGAQDRIRVDGDRMSPRPHHGILVGLAYSLPMLVVTGVYFAMTAVYSLASKDVSVVNGTLNVTGMMSLVIEAPYVGFALAIFGEIGKRIAEESMLYYGVFWFVSSLPILLVCWLGYLAGYHGKFMAWAYKRKKQN